VTIDIEILNRYVIFVSSEAAGKTSHNPAADLFSEKHTGSSEHVLMKNRCSSVPGFLMVWT
jgi:hypothetical protein